MLHLFLVFSLIKLQTQQFTFLLPSMAAAGPSHHRQFICPNQDLMDDDHKQRLETKVHERHSGHPWNSLMGRKHKQKPIREHGTYICCRTALIRWRWTTYMDLGLGLLLVLAKTNLNMGSASNFPMNSNSMKPIFLFYSNSLCPFKRKYITIKTTIICFLVFGQQRQHTGCSRL